MHNGLVNIDNVPEEVKKLLDPGSEKTADQRDRELVTLFVERGAHPAWCEAFQRDLWGAEYRHHHLAATEADDELADEALKRALWHAGFRAPVIPADGGPDFWAQFRQHGPEPKIPEAELCARVKKLRSTIKAADDGHDTRAVLEQRRAAMASSMEIAAYTALRCMPVHSVTADGTCTCDWPREKKYRQKNKGAEMPLDHPSRCPSPGKHPKGRAWNDEAWNDIDAIEARWSDEAFGGYVNLGIAVCNEDRVVILDFDGPEGIDTYKRMTMEGELPDTLTAVTGSGGVHVFLRLPADGEWKVKNTVRAMLGYPGVDTRGGGGYVNANGSRHPSVTKLPEGIEPAIGRGLYGWMDDHGPRDVPLADAPRDILLAVYFATGDHDVAPDGTKRSEEQRRLAHEADAKAKGKTLYPETGAATTTSGADDDSGVDWEKLAREAGGSNAFDQFGGSWQDKLARIGDDVSSGQAGNFDNQIRRVMCAYFTKYGAGANEKTLVTALREHIEKHGKREPGKTPIERYSGDDYLKEQVAKAREDTREFIAKHGPKPAPEALDYAALEQMAADIPDDLADSDPVDFRLAMNECTAAIGNSIGAEKITAVDAEMLRDMIAKKSGKLKVKPATLKKDTEQHARNRRSQSAARDDYGAETDPEADARNAEASGGYNWPMNAIMDGEGWLAVTTNGTEKKPGSRIRLCKVFKPNGRKQAPGGDASGLLISFVHESTEKRFTIGADVLLTSPVKVIGALFGAGLQVNTTEGAVKLLGQLLGKIAVDEKLPTITELQRPGFDFERGVFALNTGEILGENTSDITLVSGAMIKDRKTRGDEAESLKVVDACFATSHLYHCAHAVLVALSGPVMQAANIRSGLFGSIGQPDKGKSVGAACGAHTWGNPAEGEGVLHVMDATAMDLEFKLAKCTGHAIFLDEAHTINDDLFAMLPFKIEQEHSRGRTEENRSTGKRESEDGVTWREPVFYTSEKSYKEKVTKARKPTPAGAYRRVREATITEDMVLTPEMDEWRYVEALKALEWNYGHLGKRFVKAFMAEGWHRSERREKLAQEIEQIALAMTPVMLSPGRMFAACIWAGRAAQRYGIIKEGRDTDAVEQWAWGSYVGSAGVRALRGVEESLDILRTNIAAAITTGKIATSVTDVGDANRQDVWGLISKSDGLIHLYRTRLDRLCGDLHNIDAILDRLAKDGMLVERKKGKLPNGKPRMVKQHDRLPDSVGGGQVPHIRLKIEFIGWGEAEDPDADED